MTNYVIDYNTGVRTDFEGTLEEAKDAAEHGMGTRLTKMKKMS